KKLVTHFRRIISPAILARAQTFGFDLQALITFASLVEKETARADERRLVASVYHNRLKKNMLLGCDPTLIYMLVQRGEWDGNIRRKHFSIKDPYNSYLYRGLPPGPIANPGLARILASLEPEDSQFLYFVGKNDGTGSHDFSKTLREHNNKVNRYQRRRHN
ncbi:MAG: endolytic transglycosylase MltG, partial [Candidatus Marinimicrobia bacterium]|nr:endolytic transglycosylase MltG [Candidatus Neomarinimicrobiota bacterium]